MKKNLFGTDGIRAHVGSHPLTMETLPLLGRAIGQWAIEKYGSSSRLLLAHDTRNSCHWVKTALLNGLILHDLMVDDAAVLPTPAVLCLLHNATQWQAGIIISASHNPYHDNGIKLCDSKTGKISESDELRISELFTALINIPASYARCGISTPITHAEQQYAQAVTEKFTSTLCSGKKIVLDCAHGATYSVAPTIFRALGADVIVLNDQPTGFLQ